MFNIDLAIKFGSNEILVYSKGLGIVAKEPAFLAVIENGKKIKVQASGKQAEKLFHSKSSNVTVYQPIVNGEIENEKMATILISEILKQAITKNFLLKSVSAIVAVPCALKEEALKKLKHVLQECGISKPIFVPNAVCVRETLELEKNAHVMVVDIGKQITDISVVNGYDIAFGRMYYIGGETMDTSITTFIQDNHNLEVSDLTSEAVKNEVASLYERDLYTTEYIGIDENNKFIRKSITANEVRVAIQNVYDKIFELIEEVLKLQPKEIVAELYTNGVVFVGGGSKISGLYEYAKKKLDMPIIVPDEPTNTVVLGAGKLLNRKDFVKIQL